MFAYSNIKELQSSPVENLIRTSIAPLNDSKLFFSSINAPCFVPENRLIPTQANMYRARVNKAKMFMILGKMRMTAETITLMLSKVLSSLTILRILNALRMVTPVDIFLFVPIVSNINPISAVITINMSKRFQFELK